MVDVIVRRNGGAHPGDDIVSPFSSTTVAAIKRGTQELDDNGSDTTSETYSMKFDATVRQGHLVEISDAAEGRLVRGRITRIAHKFDSGPDIETEIVIAPPSGEHAA